MRLGTIISYCTNDFRFISKCIEEAKKVSTNVTVIVCDHFFDGTPENRFLLDNTYAKHPECQFIEFSYLADRIYSPFHQIGPEDWAKFWAATSRYIGYYYSHHDYLLFLDSDEILNGEKCREWLETKEYTSYEAMRFASYLYAIKPTIVAKKVVNLPLLVKRDAFSPLTLLNDLERIGAFLSHAGPKKEKIVGLDKKPFVHHYSWVRTKEECLWKTKTWSHREEEDWTSIIESAFSGDYAKLIGSFEEDENPYFDPFIVSFPVDHATRKGNLLKINDRDLLVASLPI